MSQKTGMKVRSTNPGMKARFTIAGMKEGFTNPGMKARSINPGMKARFTNPGMKARFTNPEMKARITNPFLSFAPNTHTLYMQNIVFILQKIHISLYFEFNNPWLPFLVFSFNRKRTHLQLVSQSSTGKTHERGTMKAGGSYQYFLIEGCC